MKDKSAWRFLFFFLVGVCLTSTLNADEPVEGKLDSFLGEPVLTVQQVFKQGRFPNVVVTKEGTVVATFGQEQVRAKRSQDGGKTWGEEIAIAAGIHGGGTTVDESTGDIFAFVEEAHPPAPLAVYRSKDDGKTWIAESVTIHADSNGNMPSMHMNEHGITLRTDRSDRSATGVGNGAGLVGRCATPVEHVTQPEIGQAQRRVASIVEAAEALEVAGGLVEAAMQEEHLGIGVLQLDQQLVGETVGCRAVELEADDGAGGIDVTVPKVSPAEVGRQPDAAMFVQGIH